MLRAEEQHNAACGAGGSHSHSSVMLECFVWLQSWCVCFFPLPSHLTPPLHYYPFPLCSGDWVQKDIRPHYSITNAVSAINAHTRFMPQDNCGREGWVTGNIQLYSMTVDVLLYPAGYIDFNFEPFQQWFQLNHQSNVFWKWCSKYSFMSTDSKDSWKYRFTTGANKANKSNTNFSQNT